MIEAVHFCGGGYTVLSYIGVIRYFETHPSDVLVSYELSGTSAGAVFAYLLCIGYSYKDFVRIVFSFYDELSSLFRLNDISLYETHGSLCDIERLWKFLEELSSSKQYDLTTLTFGSLYERTQRMFTVTGTSLNTRKCEYFNAVSYPDMCVLDALRISTCIPLLFRPICYNDQYFVDGALTDIVKDRFLVIRNQAIFNCDTFVYPIQNIVQYLSTFYNVIIGIVTVPKSHYRKCIVIEQSNFFYMLSKNATFVAVSNGYNSTQDYFKKHN